ncbi:hypothetical protein AB0L05_33930 [Nonomuraea pusilla]|uniref:hypothetical protein n=1 Tax=Nonomuraea pusilla TaxID=46177 RepID=UPI003329D557
MSDARSVHTHLHDYERHLAQLDRLRAILEEELAGARGPRAARIEAALDRMDRGLYGACGRCGAFIPYERLLRTFDRPTCDACAAGPDAEHDRRPVAPRAGTAPAPGGASRGHPGRPGAEAA